MNEASSDLPIYNNHGELDPEKLLAHLARLGEQVSIKRSLRPNLTHLSTSIATFRDLANNALLGGNDHLPFAPRPLSVARDGSPASSDADRRSESSSNNSNALVLELVHESLVAISDHLWALVIVLRENPPLRPLLATGRIVLDAACHINYLLDASIDDSQRTVRALNIEIASLGQEIADADSESNPEDALASKAELLRAGDADGLQRVVSKKGVTQLAFSPALEPTATMANRLLTAPFGAEVWRVTSSVVHARDRSLIEFVAGRGDIDMSKSGLEMGISYLGACLLGGSIACLKVAAYLGRSSDELSRAADAVNLTVGALFGALDEHLLDAAGVDRSYWV